MVIIIMISSGVLPDDPQETRGEVKKQLIIKILTINDDDDGDGMIIIMVQSSSTYIHYNGCGNHYS